MAAVKNFSWEAEVVLTRRQVVSLGILAEYVGNIVKQLKTDFPSGLADVSEESIREAFHEFRRVYSKDQELYKRLTEVVVSVNAK